MPIEFAFKLPLHGQAFDAPFAQTLELAAAAEDAGFSSLYVIDHLYLPGSRTGGRTSAGLDRPYFLDAWCTLAAVAARTTRVRLGPQVTPIGLRHPVFIAKWGATIDRISNGRFRLGVGLGHQEVEYVSYGFRYPPFKERFARMTEGVEIIRRLWTDEQPVSYDGKHYSVKDVAFWPKPIQSRVPIWYGGTSPSIRRGVARLGDGWFPALPQLGGFGPTFFSESITAIREDARAQGRSERIGAGALFVTTISEDPKELEKAGAMLQRRTEYAGLSVEELKAKGAIVMGTPEEICTRLEPYVKAGVEEITITFHPLDDIGAMRRGIALYAEKVMPYFT